jgi:CubicO group peptidase (beta-lactamase class C family)
LLRTSIIATAVAAVGCAGLSLHRARVLERVRAATALPPGAFESLEALRIGGIDQWIFVRALDPRAPVLLFVHGGPGSPLMPLARDFEGPLARHFVVVHWDQRGAGKSFSLRIPRDSMTRERFVADAVELTERLRARFGVERIFLAASSWGTVLGADLVSRRPDLFHAFVAMATDVHGPRGEEISYAYVRECLRGRGETERLRALEEIGPPPYDSVLDVARQRQWLRRCGGMFHDPEGTSFVARYGYASPEYSLLDVVRFAVGEAFSGVTMVRDLLGSVDLLAQVPRIEVPVFFFQGRHDRQTPSVLVEEYFAHLDAPRGKRLFWFEHSAHDLYREEPERMQRLLVEEVLPLAERPPEIDAAIESPPLDPALRALGPEILRQMDRDRVPGLQLAVWHRGRLVWSRGFGLADVARGAPIVRASVLRAGSISKLFTATLAMQQVEAGRLALDDDVNRHVPDERRVRSPDGRPAPVTLRQLLSHRSGLPSLGSGVSLPELVGMWWGLAPIPNLDRYLANGLRLRRTPGAVLRYSNDAFILLGWTVAHRAGVEFSLLARRAIFDRLGMRASDFDPESPRIRGSLASVYRLDDGGWTPALEWPGVWPSGSLHTTAEDLLQFARMVLDDGRLGDQRVLAPRSLEEMTRLESRPISGADRGFGLGFRITRYRGARLLCHEGGNPGIAARLCIQPERELAVAVLVNGEALATPATVVNRILDVYLPPRASPDVQVQGQVRITGTYRPVDLLPDPLSWLEPFVRIPVREGADGLEIEMDEANPMRLVATRDPWTFELRGGPGDGEHVVFRPSSEGELHAYAAIYHLREAPRWTDPRLLGIGLLLAVSAIAARRSIVRREARRARSGEG